jgi:hypothetical protein
MITASPAHRVAVATADEGRRGRWPDPDPKVDLFSGFIEQSLRIVKNADMKPACSRADATVRREARGGLVAAMRASGRCPGATRASHVLATGRLAGVPIDRRT